MASPALLAAPRGRSGGADAILRLFAIAAGLALLAAWTTAPARAQDLDPVPPLTARVMDRSGTLEAAQRQALEDKLAAFEASHGTQIVVLMVPTTGHEDIAAYAFRVADAWKIGRREVGDGILMVVAKNDRRARIEVARALEGAVPDLAAFQIINRIMGPAFREDDYAGGLNAAIDALIGRITGENLPPPDAPETSSGRPSTLEGLGALLFMGVPVVGGVLVAIFGRKLGSLVTAGAAGGIGLLITGSILLAILAAVLAFVFVLALGLGGGGGGRGGPPMGRGPVIWGGGGGGFGGRGGGGFRSGGGGSFGGGGASGGW